jgi:hypothetical protein
VRDKVNLNFQELYKAIGDNADSPEATIDDAVTLPTTKEGGKGGPRMLINFLAAMIKAITGKAHWYDKPAKSIAQLITDLGTKLTTADILDSKTSTATDKALSANQGRLLQEGKVDKVEGKGLSANDLTNELLSKLNGKRLSVLCLPSRAAWLAF